MTERGSLFSAERRELIEDVGTFVCSLVAIAVYFMCAFVDAPFWAYVWLLVIPLWQGVRWFVIRAGLEDHHERRRRR
jgi:hypothetical protein